MRARVLIVALVAVPVLVAAVLVVVLLSRMDAGGQAAEPEPEGLPSVTLERFDAPGSVDLATLEGPLVLNLWQSTCAPCRIEMPVLEEFSTRYAGRVDVVGVDYQETSASAARDLVAETGVTYDLLSDPDGTLNGAGPFPALRALPFLALVDADGEVVHMEYVALDSLAELEALVEEHLGVSG